MTKSAERAGKPDVGELVRQGRLQYNQTRGLDPNPNPEIGAVANPDTGMRAGMTPEKYHRLVLLSERKRRLNKEWDFLPELEDHEYDIYIAWLKSGGPKKMKAIGREAARSQAGNAMELLKKYDPENAAKLAAIPSAQGAEARDAIGSVPEPEAPVEEDEEVETEEVVDATETDDETPDLAPEAQVDASPEEAPGYTSVDPDAEDGEPKAVTAPKRKRGPNKKK